MSTSSVINAYAVSPHSGNLKRKEYSAVARALLAATTAFIRDNAIDRAAAFTLNVSKTEDGTFNAELIDPAGIVMPIASGIEAYTPALMNTSTTAFSLDYSGSDCVITLAWSDRPTQHKNYLAVLAKCA